MRLHPQYEALETLHETYRAQWLSAVGVPCNQFGGREPGTQVTGPARQASAAGRQPRRSR
ncbi:hypothetical protein [Arthrobacter sp. LAPM80]|uniref:hypothetical protein n=1 Tax=Arthrobacter sp. LAPM80 TaxID=3141788 RepID=UPI00398B89F5